MEIIIVLSISLLVFGLSIVGFRSFSERRTLTEGTSEVKDKLRLIRAKAMGGEKPSMNCTLLLYYLVDIPESNKILFSPVCFGVEEELAVGEEYEVDRVSLSPDGNWPIRITALEGTVSQEAVLTISFQGQSRSLVVSPSGNIE